MVFIAVAYGNIIVTNFFNQIRIQISKTLFQIPNKLWKAE